MPLCTNEPPLVPPGELTLHSFTDSPSRPEEPPEARPTRNCECIICSSSDGWKNCAMATERMVEGKCGQSELGHHHPNCSKFQNRHLKAKYAAHPYVKNKVVNPAYGAKTSEPGSEVRSISAGSNPYECKLSSCLLPPKAQKRHKRHQPTSTKPIH